MYLAGGAYVQGQIAIRNARNVVVRGRGIVDSSAFFGPGDGSTILIERSSDVGIRDLTLLRAQSITIGDSKRITVANVREINPDKWSDGVSVNASKRRSRRRRVSPHLRRLDRRLRNDTVDRARIDTWRDGAQHDALGRCRARLH